MEIKIATQQHKSINLRDMFMSMSRGLPVNNVHYHQTFDLDKEPDFDAVVVDDFSDKLETMELHRQLVDDITDKVIDHQKSKKDKDKDIKSKKDKDKDIKDKKDKDDKDDGKTPPPDSSKNQDAD